MIRKTNSITTPQTATRAVRRAAGLALGFAALVGLSPDQAMAQSDSTITYQGVLSEGAGAYTGSADFHFRLWDSEVGGTQVGKGQPASGVSVEGGLFDTAIDFGVSAFDDGRWLEILVRAPAWDGAGSPPPFTTLTPRQAITAAPYSIQTRGIVVDADENVGIGTASPQSALHVVGDESTGSTGALRIASGSQTMLLDGNEIDTNAGIGLTLNYNVPHNVLLAQGGGNVGIGVTNPQARLDVAGWVRAEVVQITGGSDIAEPFDIAGADVKPGMVVCIDADEPGDLRLSERAYDRTVAGIISGAGGVRPGVTLTQTGTVADGQHPVALTGRVWCYVDAGANGPITPGDLLTTSDVPGHAMRADSGSRANGAVLGKAMTALPSGRGLVLVLVNLQ